MTWWSVQPAIERQLPEMIDIARDVAEEPATGGSLELDADVRIPREVTDLDVHLMPGCWKKTILEISGTSQKGH